MGQAKQRGTFEQRKFESMSKNKIISKEKKKILEESGKGPGSQRVSKNSILISSLIALTGGLFGGSGGR